MTQACGGKKMAAAAGQQAATTRSALTQLVLQQWASHLLLSTDVEDHIASLHATQPPVDPAAEGRSGADSGLITPPGGSELLSKLFVLNEHSLGGANCCKAWSSTSAASDLLEDLAKMKLLGRGGCGTVYQAEWRGAKVAAKVIVSDTDQKLYDSMAEAVTGRMLSHPHVLHTYTSIVLEGKDILSAIEASELFSLDSSCSLDSSHLGSGMLSLTHGADSSHLWSGGGSSRSPLTPKEEEASLALFVERLLAPAGAVARASRDDSAASTSCLDSGGMPSSGRSLPPTMLGPAPPGQAQTATCTEGHVTSLGPAGNPSASNPLCPPGPLLTSHPPRKSFSRMRPAELSRPSWLMPTGMAAPLAGPPSHLSSRASSDERHAVHRTSPIDSAASSPLLSDSAASHKLAFQRLPTTAPSAAPADISSTPPPGQGPRRLAKDPFSCANVLTDGQEALSMSQVADRMMLRPAQHVTVIVMEFCDRGCIGAAIKRGMFRASEGRWSASTAYRALIKTAKEVVQGLAYIHGLGITHGDLKPGNVLLKSTRLDRRGFSACISDFGFSTPTESAVPGRGMATLAYTAPEAVDGPASPAADVWSFGVMLNEMVTGKHPFYGMHWAALLAGLVHGSISVEWPEDMDRLLRQTGKACLEFDPANRPTAAVVCKVLVALEENLKRQPGRT